jgi:hypothetical protein
MPGLQQPPPEERLMVYSPAVWLIAGLLFGYILCRLGVG